MQQAAPLPQPTSLEEARAIIAQLLEQLQLSQWQVEQLKRQLFGPSADKLPVSESFSKEQTLLEIFAPPSEAPATQDVVLPEGEASPADQPKRRARHPQPKIVERVVER